MGLAFSSRLSEGQGGGDERKPEKWATLGTGEAWPVPLTALVLPSTFGDV